MKSTAAILTYSIVFGCFFFASKLTNVAHGQQRTVRWFSVDAEAALESETSRRLVARNNTGPGEPVIEQFGRFGQGGTYYASDFILRDEAGDIILDLSDTIWTRLPVLHITEEGVDQYNDTYWLHEDNIDLPSPGMTTATGVESEVVKFVTFGVSRIPAGNGSNSGKLRLDASSPTQLTLYLSQFNK